MVNIPNTVRKLNNFAFSSSNVKRVNIPKSTVQYGDSLFSSCTKLEYIDIDDNNPVMQDIDGVVYTKTGKTLIMYPMAKSGDNYTINSGTEAIGQCAFYQTNVKSVSIPSSVIRISSAAFSKSKLTSISIPNTVQTIQGGCCYQCTSLTSITLPSNMTVIPPSVCAKCSSLTTVTKGNNITEIGFNAFAGCSSLTSFTIPQSVTTIKDNAFDECTKLSTVRIPSNVTKIGSKAFHGIKSGARVTFDNYSNITEVGDYAFGIGNIVIDQNAKNYILSLNSKAFDQNWVSSSVSTTKYVWAEQ